MAERLVNRLKDERARLGWTQAELADRVGVSRKTINTVENGVFVPSTTLALKLEHSEDKQALDILEETRQEISQVVLALMLHSERNLFEELRRVVEKGGDAEPLRRRLHALRDHIEGNDLVTKLMQ